MQRQPWESHRRATRLLVDCGKSVVAAHADEEREREREGDGEAESEMLEDPQRGAEPGRRLRRTEADKAIEERFLEEKDCYSVGDWNYRIICNFGGSEEL